LNESEVRAYQGPLKSNAGQKLTRICERSDFFRTGSKDFEALTRTHLAFVQLAMIRLMLRRIARASQTS
jgi:hypothetical protein